jgi:hypothetical protein
MRGDCSRFVTTLPLSMTALRESPDAGDLGDKKVAGLEQWVGHFVRMVVGQIGKAPSLRIPAHALRPKADATPYLGNQHVLGANDAPGSFHCQPMGEARRVIGMRSMILATGRASALREFDRLIPEKIAALMELKSSLVRTE